VVGIIVTLDTRLGQHEHRATRIDHEASRHALPSIRVEQLLRGTHDDNVDSQVACCRRDGCGGIGPFEYAGIARYSCSLKCLSDGIGYPVPTFCEVCGGDLFAGVRGIRVAKWMPVVSVDALEKISGNLDNCGDSHSACAADEVASEFDYGGRAECAGGGNKYVHPVSIGVEILQRSRLDAR